MRKLAKWFVLVVVVIGALYGYAVHRDFYYKEIRDLIRDDTGYLLHKNGPAEFSLLPSPSLTYREITLANSQTRLEQALWSANSIVLKLQWAQLAAFRIVMDIAVDTSIVHLQRDRSGVNNWMTEEMKDVSGGLPFELDQMTMRDTRLIYREAGTGDGFGVNLDHLGISLSHGKASSDIYGKGRIAGVGLAVEGELGYETATRLLTLNLELGAGQAGSDSDDDLTPPTAPSGPPDVRQQLPLSALLSGSLQLDEHGFPAGTLAVEASARSLDQVRDLVGISLPIPPGIGPVEASGELRISPVNFDIDNLQFRINNDALDVDIKGTARNLLSSLDLNLTADLEVRKIDRIAEPLSLESIPNNLVEGVGPVLVHGLIRKTGPRVEVSEIDASTTLFNYLAKLDGEIVYENEKFQYYLEHQGKSPDARVLVAALGLENRVPLDPGPASLDVVVSGSASLFKIERARASLQNGNIRAAIRGDVDVSSHPMSFNLQTGLEIGNASDLGLMLPDSVAPFLEKLVVEMDGQIEGTSELFSIKNLELELARENQKLALKGDLQGLPEHPVPDLQIHWINQLPIELEPLFPKLAGYRLTGPLDLSARIAINETEVQIHDLFLQANRSDIRGSVQADLSERPLRISAALRSDRLEHWLIESSLESEPDIQPEPGSADAADPNLDSTLSAEQLGEIFSAYTHSIGIQTDWIKGLDLDVRYSSKQARLGNYDLANVMVVFFARDGLLNLVEYSATLDDRPMSFVGSIDAETDPPTYHLAGRLEGDTLESLISDNEGLLSGGALSGEITLTSEGETLGELIENLDGGGLIEMGPLTIHSRALSVISSDILSSMLKGILKTEEGDPTSEYNCGVLGVDIKGGIARVKKTFAMEANEYNLGGKGLIDLNTGFVDLAVFPKARKGLGFNLSNIIGGFQIKGNLATPDFGVKGGGLLTAAVTGYALTPALASSAVATPTTATVVATGLIAKGFFDRLTASQYKCEATLKRIKRARSKGEESDQH